MSAIPRPEPSKQQDPLELHKKRDDYTRNGVLEYVVVCLGESQLRWFDLRTEQELPVDADAICRLRTFPGLWIDSAALFKRNLAGLTATLRKGLATPEHAEFVARLAAGKQVS